MREGRTSGRLGHTEGDFEWMELATHAGKVGERRRISFKKSKQHIEGGRGIRSRNGQVWGIWEDIVWGEMGTKIWGLTVYQVWEEDLEWGREEDLERGERFGRGREGKFGMARERELEWGVEDLEVRGEEDLKGVDEILKVEGKIWKGEVRKI